MHIPDSVLSPATSAAAGAAMLPVWAVAGRRVHQSLQTRQVPMLALGAAFCFVVMMFNIPAFGGTTAHPVAGTLLAIMLGPWAAMIGLSVTLAIQALFFGDGGLLAYGANCFTMAFVLPFVGYSVYRFLTGIGVRVSGIGQKPVPAVRALAPPCAAIGAYVGINAAAAVVAVLLGIQPALYHETGGHALYFPFGLKVTLPAMLGTHLLVAGPAEAVVTALVVAYLQRAGFPLYGMTENGAQTTGRRRRWEPLWVGLLALVALSPLGLLASGDAWGEWDAQGVAEQIKKTDGQEYVPKGVAQAEEHAYKGIGGLSDYASDRGAKGYIIAGLLGIGVVSGLLFLGGRLLARRDVNDGQGERGNRQQATGNRQQGIATGRSPTPYTLHPTPHPRPPLPEWLRRPSDENAPPPDKPGRPPNRFVERTLGEMADAAAASLAGERWARQPGYLQRLDPRAKVIAVFGLIAVVACLHSAVTLLALYALTEALALASRLPFGMLAKRVWLSVPLFVAAIALPSLLNIVTPGRVLIVLWPHPWLAITAPGLAGAAGLTLRVGVAVALATLLTLTTGWNDLLRALRALFVSRLFVSVLAMTYRYVTVLLKSAAEMFTARRSRTVGRTTNAEGRRFVGTRIGALFGKTLALSEEVHAAMLSRGFNGEVRTLTSLQWRTADSLWTLAILLAAILALGGDYVHLVR
jgi:cobalt/nickel transport system permease protein